MNSRYSPGALRIFELFFHPWMRRRIQGVHIAGLPVYGVEGRALLLVANHVSWWDGFVLRELHRVLRPRSPLYTIMAEEQLRRVPFFRLLGVMGIDRNQPSSILCALRTLQGSLARHPNTLTAFFPQGRIWPSHRRPLGFERGVEVLLRRLPLLPVPIGIHAEPLSRVSPTYFVSVGKPLAGQPSVCELERAVEAEVDRIHTFLAVHGEEAPGRWPPPHQSLATAPVVQPGAQ